MNIARIEVNLDCGNCPMQSDEELWLKTKISKLCEFLTMEIRDIKIYR